MKESLEWTIVFYKSSEKEKANIILNSKKAGITTELFFVIIWAILSILPTLY